MEGERFSHMEGEKFSHMKVSISLDSP